MSCSGCRVLRKRCSDNCTLRSCLQWIQGAEAQGHATAFVAKFFGRAGLTNFITAVPENQRAALFRSLLYEACGRTVNPVHGAVGLLWSGNWQACQAAVEAVLKGEILQPVTASLPAGLHESSFTHFPLTELGRQPEGGFSALPVWQHLSTGTVMDRAHEVSVEQDSFRPSLQLSSSDCGRELLKVGFRTVKTNPIGDDICNFLKTMQPERNGELHPRKKAFKRKQEDANSQQPVGSAPQRTSTGIETLLEAIHRTDQALEAPPESDIVLDLTLSSHPATTPPCQRHKVAVTRNTSPEDHSVSSEGSVTSLDTAGLSVSQVALVQRQLTLSKHMGDNNLAR